MNTTALINFEHCSLLINYAPTMRSYFYTLTERGELFHGDVAIEDERFRDMFFANLQPNNTGQYPDYPFCSPCGVEMNYVRPVDTPYVFERLDGERLFYSPSMSVPFDIEALAFDDGVLYHRAPHQQWGRVSASVVVGLVTTIEPWGEWYEITWHGNRSVIPPRIIPEHLRLLRPRRGNWCAGCGRDNPVSLQLSALYNCRGRTAESWLTIPQHTSGSLGIMHGGFVAFLLDEIMGKVLSGMDIKAPTRRLEVEYIRPVLIDSRVYLSAHHCSSK
ncbi:MAG: DUF4505 family protein, partial [Chlorobi bacterium]|nr:DUF4505 family protein [Chlorobiota bacterium]